MSTDPLVEPAAPVPPRKRRGISRSFGPRWALVGIFLLLVVQAIAYARAFLIPVVFALLLTLVFSPMRRFLGRMGISSGFSALLIVTVLMTALVLALSGLATPFSEWLDNAPEIARQIQQKIGEIRDAAEGVREAAEQVDTITSGEEVAEGEDVQRIVVDEPGNAVDMALAAPAILAQMFFTLVLMFFLLASGDMFYEKIVYVLPTFGDKRRAMRIAYDIERKLSRYLFTITVINAGLGFSIGVAMWLLGMPNPVLFGVIGFVLNYIPYIGAILGVAAAASVALVSLDQVEQVLIVAGAYFGLTAFEGQIVTPYFIGRSLRLNTVVVFLSVTLWAWLWSVTGMLVATPLLVMVRTLCEHIPALEGLGHFLSARGAERTDVLEAEAKAESPKA